VSSQLCMTAVHHTAQNGSDNLPAYPQNNHQCNMSRNAGARDRSETTNLEKHMLTAMFLKPGRHRKGCGNRRWRTCLETARRLDDACQRRQHSSTQLGILHLECQWMCWSCRSLDTHTSDMLMYTNQLLLLVSVSLLLLIEPW